MNDYKIESKWYNFLKIFVNWIVDNAEFLMVRAMALLAPVPSAWALYMSFEDTAGITLAWVLAIVIEFMGLCLGVFIADVSSFNNQHSNKKLWSWTSWVVFSAYLVAVLIIIGMSGAYSYMVFPLFTLAGAVVIGSRNHMNQVGKEHHHKEEIVESREQTLFDVELEERKRLFDQKLEIEKMRAMAKLNSVARTVARTVAENSDGDTATPVPQEERRSGLLQLLQQFGDLGATEFGRRLGTDRTTVYRDLKELDKAGMVHRNSVGWTVGPDPEGES